MTVAKVKVVPLEYVPMGAPPSLPVWPSLISNKEPVEDQAQMLARIQQLNAEKADLLHGRDLEIAAARSEGYEAGRRQQQEQHAADSEVVRIALMRAVEEFNASRDHYFAQVEREIVRLALAIAARILNREAQMDPLLLSGAVRVALGQLSESTEVQLRVPSAEAELWTEMLRLIPNLPLRPVIISDDGLKAGECKVETHLGTVDLGVRAQLGEIERGFFDLLEYRMKAAHVATA